MNARIRRKKLKKLRKVFAEAWKSYEEAYIDMMAHEDGEEEPMITIDMSKYEK